ncbi:uridine kinase [Mycotypha africana]|uniref:uridine kinase n=1 Tax=Mycotypha africana TaxID=64632 RepID=UPI0023013FC0|nr:uridine kinase [Mycotypha africana]KAI8983947.1 uridine kinase [Mycotypha africana]
MPFYSADGSVAKPYMIGIAGGSASGKTSVAERILKNLNVPWVIIISMDSFYNILSPENSKLAHQNRFDFDHPSAFDHDLLFETLTKLREGKSVNVPIYNFSTHSREEKTTTIYGANVIIFEGIFALYDKRIRDMMDVKIFVDTDPDIQLARRLQRDILMRGRDVTGVLDQYTRFVKPSFDNYVRPTMKFADVIIPRGLENAIAIDLMTKHIQSQLQESMFSFRWGLLDTPLSDHLPESVHVLPTTNQIKGVHTILRDRNTDRDEFVFYADRLAVLLIEHAVSCLPSQPIDVLTPTHDVYKGLKFSQKICGVSILRAGGTMEAGLKRVFSDAVFGKLLIQTNPNTGEPELHYCKLPKEIGDYDIMLMDATVGTGAAALMAIRVLLDHEVPEERIIFVCFLASRIGLTVITNAFPRIKIVTSMVDPDFNREKLWIEPGIGNFGDRYFGTEEE